MAEQSEWITAYRAKREYGVSPFRLQRLAALKLITPRLDPGITPRYRRSDVARIASETPEKAAN